MPDTESILVRDGQDSDKAFILSTMLRGLYYGDSWFSLIPKDVFMTSYHPVLEKILTKTDTVIKIACLKSEPDVIVGYSVFGFKAPNHRTLHFVYTKRAWRGLGIAKSLVPVQEINTVSHLTKTGVSMLYDRPHISFNPFILGD